MTHLWQNVIHLFVTSSAFQALLGVFIGAILAFWFNKRIQVSIQRQKLQADTYKTFVDGINDVHASLLNLSSTVSGFTGQCIVLRYIDKSIGNEEKRKKGYMQSSEIYEKWHQYDDDVIQKHLEALKKMGKVHRLVETSFFMYPRLEKSFVLLVDEYGKLEKQWKQFQDALNGVNATDLVKKEAEAEFVELSGMEQLSESCIMLHLYFEDFHSMLQHELVGSIFKFKPKKRVPEIGKVLTVSGWRYFGQ
jgi:hypothetical protein